MVFIVGGLVAVLSWMTWEDTRYRAISIWTFPVLFVGILLGQAHFISWAETLWMVKVNLVLLSVQLGGIWLYLILKHRALVNPMQGFIGWGDVLFWVAVLPAFSPLAFLLFYIVSLSVALLLHVTFRRSRLYGDATKIPLAGLQALVYSVWLLAYGFTNIPTWLTTL